MEILLKETQMKTEDRNFLNDRRTIANEYDIFDGFDEKQMTLTFTIENDDGEEEYRTFPAKFCLCELCEGKGKHVNPAIDCNGLTQDDFDDDPGFKEEYLSGQYDIDCNMCNGKRVIPYVNEDALNEKQKADYKMIKEKLEDDERYRAQCRKEMIMGY